MRWFLFSLVLWSSFALSQPDKKAGGASKGENNPGNNQSISVNLPSNINVGISGNLQVNTEKSDAKTNEEPFKASDWLLVFFNGLLAIFTALLWCSTQKLWGEAKIASGIAKSAADSSKLSADVSHKSVMPVIYPYITDMSGLHPLNIVESKPSEPWKSRLLIRLDNSGKTPAIIKQFRAKLFLMEKNELPEVNVKKFPRHTHPVIVPASVSGVTGDIDLVQPITFTRKELEELHANAIPGSNYRRFALIGVVIYDDLFGQRHTCYFCIKLRFWRDAHHPHGFQISRGTKHNRFIQEPIPKPDPLEGDPEDGDGDPA